MLVLGCDAMLMLAAEQSLCIERTAQVRLTCLSGLLWVTEEGDPRDLFPAAGDALEFRAGGVVLITALVPSIVSTCEIPERRSPASLIERLRNAVRQALTGSAGLPRTS